MEFPVVILHNIRSVQNVASMFRTADCAGVSRIILTGYTPAPADKFGRPRRDFANVALGAERTVEWKQIPRVTDAFRALRSDDYLIVAAEQAPRSRSYADARTLTRLRGRRVAFLFGNEVRGLPKRIASEADRVIEIPMAGAKESLNVAVAFGVILFMFRDCARGADI